MEVKVSATANCCEGLSSRVAPDPGHRGPSRVSRRPGDLGEAICSILFRSNWPLALTLTSIVPCCTVSMLSFSRATREC